MRRHSRYPDRDQGEDTYDHNEYDHPSSPPQSQHPRKRGCANRLGWIVAIIVFLVVVVATELLVRPLLMQNYIEMNGDIKLAQARATAIPKLRHHMTLELTFFDNAGHASYDSNCNDCIEQGDRVRLQASIINLPWWSRMFWWYSGCRLTLLESNLTAQQPDRVYLKGGDDSAFQVVPQLGGNATHSNFVVVPANGKLYNIFITQSGLLYLRLAS